MAAKELKTTRAMFPPLTVTVQNLQQQFGQIDDDRKRLLSELSGFIQQRVSHGVVNLNFICTHNSRRSHIAQLWAQVAAYYYGVSRVACFSGGTEATAFNPRAVKAMQEAGFEITKKTQSENPEYEIRYSTEAPALKVFSKKYDHPFNPKKDFAAVMTCSHADENCPVISGALKRISITYDDPKDFDNKPQEETKYRERVYQIGREMLYVFSLVRNDQTKIAQVR